MFSLFLFELSLLIGISLENERNIIVLEMGIIYDILIIFVILLSRNSMVNLFHCLKEYSFVARATKMIRSQDVTQAICPRCIWFKPY